MRASADEGGQASESSGWTRTATLELLRRGRAGDRDALERFFSRYLPRLRRWATRRLPKWSQLRFDTDELVQETLLAAVRNLPPFDPRGEMALAAYFRHALRNRICDELRRHAPPGPSEHALESLGDHGPSSLDEVVGSEALARYETALAKLREADQQLVILRVELGVSYVELAEAMATPDADAARVAVSRAVTRLAWTMNDAR